MPHWPSAITDRGAYASRPAPGNKGALWLPTDSPFTSFDDGSAWQEYVEGHPVLKTNGYPSTWVNQGVAISDVTKGGVLLSTPADSGDNVHMLMKSIPGGATYTITAGIIPSTRDVSNNIMAMFVLRNSSDGKLVTMGPARQGNFVIQENYWNSPTSYGTNGGGYVLFYDGAITWLRIKDDGVNRIWQYSPDGVQFETLVSELRTNWTTPDQIGLGVSSSSAVPFSLWLVHWDEGA